MSISSVQSAPIRKNAAGLTLVALFGLSGIVFSEAIWLLLEAIFGALPPFLWSLILAAIVGPSILVAAAFAAVPPDPD
jgi:hypothetical protein